MFIKRTPPWIKLTGISANVYKKDTTMDILLRSLKKLLEKLFFKEANERVLLKGNSFLRKNVKL